MTLRGDFSYSRKIWQIDMKIEEMILGEEIPTQRGYRIL